MNDVKRYGHISYLVEATHQMVQLYPSMTIYTLASDFDAIDKDNTRLTKVADDALDRADAQRLRADTAEAALDNYIKQAVLDTAHRQALLAAAEQRIAKMAVVLTDIRQSCELSRLRDAQIDAALNPNPEAESHE